MKFSKHGLVSLTIATTAAAFAACSSPPPSDPGTGGAGGSNTSTGGRGGSAGRGGSGGTTGGSTGGTTGGNSTGGTTGGSAGGTTGGSAGGTTGGSAGGAGGSGTGGAGGSSTDATPAETGTGGSGAGGTGGSAGAGGTGGAGGSGMPSACDYTPKGNATMASFKFVPITLMGLQTGDMAQGSGYRDGITEIKFIPGAPLEFLLAQKRGRISHYKLADANAKTATLVRTIDISGVQSIEDIGLVSMAFDPDYATNKFVFLGYGTGLTSTKLSRFTYSGTAFEDRVDILSFNSGGGGRGWHSTGSIGFDKDKNLWMLHGEFNTGAPAQNMATNLGKLLRIVPSRMAGMGGFKPAAGNAAPDSPVFARGFRSPWKGHLDGKGRYIVGDVQNTNNEEVNVVTMVGQNFGHPSCTGGGCKAPMVTWDGAGDPYDGQGDEAKEGRAGRAVWIGVQYGDCGSDRYGGAMTGVQLIGDFFTGWVRGVVINDAGTRGPDKLLGTLGTVTSWEQNPDGYLYAVKFGLYHQGAASERQGMFRACLMGDTSPACSE
jgi:hypothetical protein